MYQCNGIINNTSKYIHILKQFSKPSRQSIMPHKTTKALISWPTIAIFNCLWLCESCSVLLMVALTITSYEQLQNVTKLLIKFELNIVATENESKIPRLFPNQWDSVSRDDSTRLHTLRATPFVAIPISLKRMLTI